MSKLTIIITSILLLNACAADPTAIEVKQKGDSRLNCDQLKKQIVIAKQYKEAAHAEDEFKFKYMEPITGMMSVYRIMRADSRATDRIEHLTNLSNQIGCNHKQYNRRYLPQSMNHNVYNHAPTRPPLSLDGGY